MGIFISHQAEMGPVYVPMYFQGTPYLVYMVGIRRYFLAFSALRPFVTASALPSRSETGFLRHGWPILL